NLPIQRFNQFLGKITCRSGIQPLNPVTGNGLVLVKHDGMTHPNRHFTGLPTRQNHESYPTDAARPSYCRQAAGSAGQTNSWNEDVGDSVTNWSGWIFEFQA